MGEFTPDYKGVMATFRALMHGDSELNMTLHTIDDSGIDTGKILGYSTLEVDPSRSYLWPTSHGGGRRVLSRQKRFSHPMVRPRSLSGDRWSC